MHVTSRHCNTFPTTDGRWPVFLSMVTSYWIWMQTWTEINYSIHTENAKKHGQHCCCRPLSTANETSLVISAAKRQQWKYTTLTKMILEVLTPNPYKYRKLKWSWFTISSQYWFLCRYLLVTINKCERFILHMHPSTTPKAKPTLISSLACKKQIQQFRHSQLKIVDPQVNILVWKKCLSTINWKSMFKCFCLFVFISHKTTMGASSLNNNPAEIRAMGFIRPTSPNIPFPFFQADCEHSETRTELLAFSSPDDFF